MHALVQPSPRAGLELRTVPVPHPSAGDVLVSVAASTVHPLDFKIHRYGIVAQDWPVTGGIEFAGTVVGLGLGVDNLKLGDRIATTTIGWIEGNQVSGWQQYALVHANLCTKIPDSLSFELAATVPTSFVTASVALALDLGLKYPEPPPAPPRKTAAGVWVAALAALNGGTEFEFDLEDGVVQGGSWYPSETAMRKYANCLGISAPPLPLPLPVVPSGTESLPESERTRVLDPERYKVNNHTFRLSLDDNGLAPIASSPYVTPTQDSYRPLHVPGPHRPHHATSSSTRALHPIELRDSWDMMSWGTGDISREAMDRRFGSGWNDLPRLVQVERGSSNGSGSGSSGMTRSASDESHTSVEDEVATASYPAIERAERRQSEPSVSCPGREIGLGLAVGPAVPAARTTSPFRVSTAMSSRRHASPPYARRPRDTSPASGRVRPVSVGAPSRRPRTRPMSALEDLIYNGRPAVPLQPVVYAFDEPVLIWGGGTNVGRSALQILKRAGYSNVFVVASAERHAELSEISSPGTRFFDYRDPNVVGQLQSALGQRDLKKVLDCVSQPHTLKLVAQVVSPGATVAVTLPVQTPMPEGVELEMTKFGRCHDFDGKDVKSATFGREKMWPLLEEMLRAGEYVFPQMVHLSGQMQDSVTRALDMMGRGENVGKKLVFSV